MFKVKVCATSANIGPGFDCLGIAFDVFNEFGFERSEEMEYVGFEAKDSNNSNLVYKAYEWTMNLKNRKIENLKISFCGDIEQARGMGSSATCIIAGVVAALEISELRWSKQEVAYLASVYEGHPDNVAAAVYGGFSSALIVNDQVIVKNFEVNSKLNFYMLIPSFKLDTATSREVVPKVVLLNNVKHNLVNITMLLKAMEEGDLSLLTIAASDFIHQPYRGMLIEDFFKVCSLVKSVGAVAFLSGAGPSILVVSDGECSNSLNTITSKYSKWSVRKLNINYKGLEVIR